jgi:alpha-L-rhamnosidase
MVQSELRPVGLKCEYRVDPLGIGERSPRLSWALESEGRNQRQSAYRILLAGNEEDLEAEKNLLWDSGRVESGRTIGVEYEGEALRSGSQCVLEGACLGRGQQPFALQPPGRLRCGPA